MPSNTNDVDEADNATNDADEADNADEARAGAMPSTGDTPTHVRDYRSESHVRIPPRESAYSAQSHLLTKEPVKIEPREPPPPRMQKHQPKFANVPELTVLVPGSTAPNVPGVFQQGGYRPSPGGTSNASIRDSSITPSPNVPPPTAVLVEEHSGIPSDVRATEGVPTEGRSYSGGPSSCQSARQSESTAHYGESPPLTHDSSAMQNQTPPERGQITKCHVFIAVTVILLAIIIGLSIALTSRPESGAKLPTTAAPTSIPVKTNAPMATPPVRTTSPTPSPVTPVTTSVPTPAPTSAPTPAPVETEPPTRAPVSTNAPTPAPVETDTPTRAPVRTREPTPILVETDPPTGAPVSTKEPTPILVETDPPTPVIFEK